MVTAFQEETDPPSPEFTHAPAPLVQRSDYTEYHSCVPLSEIEEVEKTAFLFVPLVVFFVILPGVISPLSAPIFLACFRFRLRQELLEFAPVQPHAAALWANVDLHAVPVDLLHRCVVIRTQQQWHVVPSLAPVKKLFGSRSMCCATNL